MCMQENITLENLVLYLYNETEMTDSVLIQNAIDTNYFVKEQFDELIETVKHLDSLIQSPGKNVVDHILNYSASMSATLSN